MNDSQKGNFQIGDRVRRPSWTDGHYETVKGFYDTEAGRIVVLSRDGLCAHESILEKVEVRHIDLHGAALNRFAADCHARSLAAGWYSNGERNVGEMLMLIVSEVAEAMEGYRKDLMDDHLPTRKMIEVELGDAMIRIGDLAGYLGLDLGGAVDAKLAYNLTREDHKPENRSAVNGKRF